jgi:hypothetical protein
MQMFISVHLSVFKGLLFAIHADRHYISCPMLPQFRNGFCMFVRFTLMIMRVLMFSRLRVLRWRSSGLLLAPCSLVDV